MKKNKGNISLIIIVTITIVALVGLGIYYFYMENPYLEEHEKVMVIEELNAEMRVGEDFRLDIVPDYESFNLEEGEFKAVITYTEIGDDGSSVNHLIEDVVIDINTSSETQIITFVAGTERVLNDDITFAELKDMSGGVGSSRMIVVGEIINIENSEIAIMAEKIKRDVQ